MLSCTERKTFRCYVRCSLIIKKSWLKLPTVDTDVAEWKRFFDKLIKRVKVLQLGLKVFCRSYWAISRYHAVPSVIQDLYRLQNTIAEVMAFSLINYCGFAFKGLEYRSNRFALKSILFVCPFTESAVTFISFTTRLHKFSLC